MSQYLPYTHTKIDDTITIDQILQHSDTSMFGYIVECDLTLPKHLHDKFKPFPPCPESIEVPKDWLSEFQNILMNEIILNQIVKSLFHICMNRKIIVYIIEILSLLKN